MDYAQEEYYDTDFHIFAPGFWEGEPDDSNIICWRCLVDLGLYGCVYWDKCSGEHVCPLDVTVDKDGNSWYSPHKGIPVTEFQVIWDKDGRQQCIPSETPHPQLALVEAV